jgi:hypothetical protein
VCAQTIAIPLSEDVEEKVHGFQADDVEFGTQRARQRNVSAAFVVGAIEC